MIVVPTWPALLRLQELTKGRRWLAVTIMTLLLSAVFLVPLSIGIGTLISSFDEIASRAMSVSTLTLPSPPEWLGKVPVLGSRASSKWQELAALSGEDLSAQLSPYLGKTIRWVAQQMGELGLLFVQVLLTVIVAAVLYARGESGAELVLRFGSRLAGERGEQAVRLAGQAIRGVALGVVVTALVHALLGGIGLAVVGVPFAVLLTAVMFISSIIQVGVIPVLLCAVAWLYWAGHTTAGTVLLVWTVIIAPVDNILRPILIKQGVDLPLLLIIVGVIGGMMAFGIVGIFVGPVLLAISYTLFTAWIAEGVAADRSKESPGAGIWPGPATKQDR
jgi:predicted PurR-regulated permease PerM